MSRVGPQPGGRLSIAPAVALGWVDRELPGLERIGSRWTMHTCHTITGTRFEIGGVVGDYIRAVSEQWLKIAPQANPGILEMFRDRDRKPLRDLMAWAGEFAGKYLTAAAEVLRLTGDAELREFLRSFVRELISLQEKDGYLGPWPREYQLANRAPNVSRQQGKVAENWETWGLYHVMMGLMRWDEAAGDPKALSAACRVGDLLCRRFLGGKGPRLVELGCTEMNLAPAHGLAILHRKTGRKRYLQLARQLVEEFAAKDTQGKPLAGDYLHAPLTGLAFHQLPKPRWESLHPIMALAELHDQPGANDYAEAFERIWRSIAAGDRHNNGGFSSGEKATGNPYDPGAIETCCTIAWMALSVEMLRLSRDPRVADELELSLLNSVLGMHNPAGRWATYNTPMDGVRIASAQQIVFQSREGTPELNCCSVNSPRGLGLLADWAVMGDADGLVVNAYGPMTVSAPLAGAGTVTLRQQTGYPYDGKIVLRVSARRKSRFAMRLRIPRWSARTRVRVNGERVTGVQPGTYLVLERQWGRADVVEISMDLSLHTWLGRRECAGRRSLYFGPILLAYDRRFNTMDPDDIPLLELSRPHRKATWRGWMPPRLLLEFASRDGRGVQLCDFASAGQGGSPYRTWLKVSHSGPVLSEYFRAALCRAGNEPAHLAAASAPAIPGPSPDAVIRLWPGGAPNLVPDGQPEAIVNERYRNVSVPQLLVYLPPKDKATGTALIICPGGGYGHLSFVQHVDPVIELLNEQGIAVFGLKYRTQYGKNNVAADALADGQRAVRLVRSQAKQWGVNPARIGVQGYSAGSNLCLNLASHFDPGDTMSADVIERASSRPDFVALMCPWPNGKTIRDYPLVSDAPPTFIASARDDQSAPFAFAIALDDRLKNLGVAEEFFAVDAGGHSAFHYPTSRSDGVKWPGVLLPWLKKIGML